MATATTRLEATLTLRGKNSKRNALKSTRDVLLHGLCLIHGLKRNEKEFFEKGADV